ncbi:hypothetical protein [Bradyrhizobium sp. Bra78]|uniref:hypothetical protein n=1 Tax=Bradyrhizobium sp. Bra78 TaxID=2926010 RepID=UPI0021C91003|nr:hypothetical protein [Bradyrhizobium sp. Bra78]
MSDDFISELQTEAKLRFGKELSPSEVANEFAKHDFEARIQHLKNLKTADSFGTAREAAKRHAFERALHSTHHRLHRIDR